MPFLLAEILNFQGSAHLIGVGSLSKINRKRFVAEWQGKCSGIEDYATKCVETEQ